MDNWKRAAIVRAMIANELGDLSPTDCWTVLAVATGQALGEALRAEVASPELTSGIGRLVGQMAARAQCELELEAVLADFGSAS